MNAIKYLLYFLFFIAQINTSIFSMKNSQEKVSKLSHPLLYEQYEKAITEGQNIARGFNYDLEKINIQRRLLELLKAVKQDNTSIKNIDPISVIAVVTNNDVISATIYEEIIKNMKEGKEKQDELDCKTFVKKIFEQVEKGSKYREYIISSLKKHIQIHFTQKIDPQISEPEKFCEALEVINNKEPKENSIEYKTAKEHIEEIFENVPENRTLYEHGTEEEARKELIAEIVDIVI